MMYVHFVLALCVDITEWRRGMYESVILIFVLSAHYLCGLEKFIKTQRGRRTI